MTEFIRTIVPGVWEDALTGEEGSGRIRTELVNESGGVDVQNPLPTDGDSVYCKDVWQDESIVTDWVDRDGAGVGVACIPFTNLHTRIENTSSSNPKILRIHFNRTVAAHQVGFGCFDGGDFSNVTISLLGSGGALRSVVDDSANNTKYTSRNYPFQPELFNAIHIEFATADDVCLSNITIQKSVNVSAQIQGLRADNTIGTVSVTNGNNLKVSLEELESQISVNGNTQLRTTLYDTGGIPASVDDSTESLQVIDYAHHEVHSGSHYNICNYQRGNGINDLIEFTVTTPDTTKWGHLTFSVYSGQGATIDIYEGTNTIVGGTTITPRNNNRNSLNTSVMTVLKDPTSLVDGVFAAGYLAGAGRDAGFASRENEYILKQNESYLFRITSLANTNDISWCFEWYEHTDKN